MLGIDHQHREIRYRFENEAARKTAAIERLWRVSNGDVTVRHFIDAWRTGSFQSFEEMAVQLAMRLAEEKAIYLNALTKQMMVAIPSSIELSEPKS